MPVFYYQARDAAGASQTGTTLATSAESAAEALRRRGWLIIDIIEKSAAAVAARGAGGRAETFLPFARPRKREVERGLRQVSLMLKNGLTLLDALRTTGRNSLSKSAGRLWARVADAVETGSTFAEALKLYPREFSPLVVELARAGERAGTLDHSLERASEHMERVRELKTRVMQALFYPAIVITLTGVVALFMFIKVLPEMEKFLQSVHRKLPPLTSAVLNVSRFLNEYILQMSIGAAAIVCAIVVIARQPRARLALERALLRIPILGTIRQLSNTILFSRSLAVLISSGIGIVESLELSAGILQNPAAALVVRGARARIIEGSSFAEGMGESRAFSPLLSKMISIGERSGALDRVLEDSALYHESDLQRWIRAASALVEPVVTIAIGAVVGIVYIAFFLAIFAAAGGR
ncbi:MAG: type II secretion system F family protein [Planctomycetes bacterium]|nr:type II secretion system F family protein [Planctomycetota bacterium]